jgi:hypothetical protein
MREDTRIAARISTKGWGALRPAFEEVHQSLLSADEGVTAELTTIYVKYKDGAQPNSPVFAVVWLKTTKRIDIGLALPDESFDVSLMQRPSSLRYPPLNSFITISPGDSVPERFAEWARVAFEYRKTLE